MNKPIYSHLALKSPENESISLAEYSCSPVACLKHNKLLFTYIDWVYTETNVSNDSLAYDAHLRLYWVDLNTGQENIFKLYQNDNQNILKLVENHQIPDFINRDYDGYRIYFRGFQLSNVQADLGWAVLHTPNYLSEQPEWHLLKFNLGTLTLQIEALHFGNDLDNFQSSRGFFLSSNEDKIILLGKKFLYWLDSKTLKLVDSIPLADHFNQWFWFNGEDELLVHLEWENNEHPNAILRGEMGLMIYRCEQDKLVLKASLSEPSEVETHFAMRGRDKRIWLLQNERFISYDALPGFDYLVVRAYVSETNAWQIIAKSQTAINLYLGFKAIQQIDDCHLLILAISGYQTPQDYHSYPNLVIYQFNMLTAQLKPVKHLKNIDFFIRDCIFTEKHLVLLTYDGIRVYALDS